MNRRLSLYGPTIGVSSLLLFVVEPILAKALLPYFGGGAGVWVTSMLFFQVALLAGYLYAWGITRWGRRTQIIVHLALLAASLLALPLRLRVGSADGNPEWLILAALVVTVGLPYLLLSATSPLLQSWFAAGGEHAMPYRLFAWSNAASLAALLAYPVLIEPLTTERWQLLAWSVGYGVLVVAAAATAILYRAGGGPKSERAEAPSAHHPALWILLAACTSTLWMAVANHLSQEVAPVPFLWVLPLSVYLLSFILCFGARSLYRPAVFRWLLPVSWAGAAWMMAGRGGSAGLIWEIAVFALALFVWCMFCHGELARTKPPAAASVSFYYLMIALGGALGAVFVGVAAPNVFTTYLELPIGIIVCVLLALGVLYGWRSPRRLVRVGVFATLAFVIAVRFQAAGDVERLRNFYGALQVSDLGSGDTAVRSLYNGRTLHGVEFLAPARSQIQTAYYGPESGVGRVLAAPGSNRRVAVVGLGVGTLASYGRPGDLFRFYEINPAVVEMARRDFQFLSGSQAKIEVVTTDGRLGLEKEPRGSIDILVLDAFSDDSIPVHLLTREAFAMYFGRLDPEGILAVHLTSRYVDLAPVVEALARAMGKSFLEVNSAADPERHILAATWALVFPPQRVLPDFVGAAAVRTTGRAVKPWTDEYSNLFQVLR